MDNIYEKIPTKIFANSSEASKWVAGQIANLIRTKNPCVLGLATGSTPKQIYAELVKLHKEGLSFQNVITFNLDEYYPIHKDSLHSYWYFMHEQLFDHVDIKKENINIPNGDIPHDQIEEFCNSYEKKIIEAGGLDFQLLGIGSTGHIGFNEPGSSINSRTRLITLDRKTRSDAASSFYGIENVPKYAITMGVSTILAAREIFIIAFTESKSRIAQQVIEGPVCIQYPATYLQQHKNTKFILENVSAEQLTRNKAPWLISSQGLKGEIHIKYDLQMAKKAVIWLSQQVKKPILRLTSEDYEDNHLIDLISQVGHGQAGVVNLIVFRAITGLITGWPAGGRPDNLPDTYFTDKKATQQKRVLIFSPHPDDDVICMGGTMRKLVHQGHHVSVAYMVSGNIAVFDQDAIRFADFIRETAMLTGGDGNSLNQKVIEQIKSKQPGDIDGPDVAVIKKLIRRTEARQAAITTGMHNDHIHFLDLPFYDTGKETKNPLGEIDIKIVLEFIQKQNPDIIYAAGDLTDPHGTHRVCLQAILANIPDIRKSNPDLVVYLYRGAWQEWELERVNMAVPLSPEELYQKRMAIFKHQSQKDRPMFPGADQREFWQRSEERNRNTANLFTQLGFVNYEAIECFVDLKDIQDL